MGRGWKVGEGGRERALNCGDGSTMNHLAEVIRCAGGRGAISSLAAAVPPPPLPLAPIYSVLAPHYYYYHHHYYHHNHHQYLIETIFVVFLKFA